MIISGSPRGSDSCARLLGSPSFAFLASAIDTAIACDLPGVTILGCEEGWLRV
jgi:hypothetical protein